MHARRGRTAPPLFTTSVHPEQAHDAASLQRELGKLQAILSGKVNAIEARQIAMQEHLVSLADRFPSVPVILGHLGGVHWLEAIELARPRPNLYLDLSATFSPLAPQMAIQALPERTLFSADAPYGDPLLSRRMIERVTESPEVRARVLGGNIAELLQL